MAHVAHFPFETRPIIDFDIGNERYGGPFRYLGRRAIFPKQTLRAAGIWIFVLHVQVVFDRKMEGRFGENWQFSMKEIEFDLTFL